MTESQSDRNCYICNISEEKPNTHYSYTCTAIYGFEHSKKPWDNLNTHNHKKFVCPDCVLKLEKKSGDIFRSIDKLVYDHIKELKGMANEISNKDT